MDVAMTKRQRINGESVDSLCQSSSFLASSYSFAPRLVAIGGLIAKNNKDKKSDPGLASLPAIDQQPDLSSDGFYFIKAPLFLQDDNPVLSSHPDKQFANATRKSKADNHSHFQIQRLPDTPRPVPLPAASSTSPRHYTS